MAARKMMLVPAEVIENLQRKASLLTPPTTKLQLSLDKEMENILKSNLPD